MFHSGVQKPSGNFIARANVVDLEVYAKNAELCYEDVATLMINVADVQQSGFNGAQVNKFSLHRSHAQESFCDVTVFVFCHGPMATFVCVSSRSHLLFLHLHPLLRKKKA